MAIYRVTIFGHMETGEEWNTTWHVSKATGQAAVVSAAAVDAITTAWSGTNSPAGKLETYYSADLGVDGVRTDELDFSNKNVSQIIASLALVGVAADPLLPPNLAVGVSLRTDLPQKSGRGRNFLPSPVITTVAAQKIDTTVQTAIKNAWLAALNSMLADTCRVVIYNALNRTFQDVVSVDVGDVFDVQNRRRNQQTEVRVRSNLS